ncbi:MAG: hypothetical protein Q4F79_04315 [Eubacteriales bacterium]|nr:hypothetical protein [Eubacteriales bacterium]
MICRKNAAAPSADKRCAGGERRTLSGWKTGVCGGWRKAKKHYFMIPKMSEKFDGKSVITPFGEGGSRFCTSCKSGFFCADGRFGNETKMRGNQANPAPKRKIFCYFFHKKSPIGAELFWMENDNAGSENGTCKK